MSKIKIVSAIAGKAGVTLYLIDGKQMNLPKDSWKTAAIMDKVTKPLARGKVVSLDLDDYCAHKQVEKKSGGLIKFVTKKVKGLFGREGLHETTVAMIDGKEVNGIEAIENQVQRAANGNSKGLENFLRRTAQMVEDRQHTVYELLEFMRKADLPVADDGSIIAYKRLQRREDGFADCYTGKVTQKVGTLVRMHRSMVDPDRRNECSSGLHIARRGYLSGFYGDVIVLVKVAPEDVVAVPRYDNNKMRVAAYHIVADVTDRAFDTLTEDRPMTSEPSIAQELGDVIAGNHVGIQQRVTINGPRGEDLEIEDLDSTGQFVTREAAEPAHALDDEKSHNVDIRKLRKEAEEARAEADRKAAMLTDALKEKAPDKAATTGDMSAAVSQVEQAREEAVSSGKPVTTATQKPAKKKPAPKRPAKGKGKTELPKKYVDALAFVKEGGSQRQAEKKFKVCAKKLRKLIREGN